MKRTALALTIALLLALFSACGNQDSKDVAPISEQEEQTQVEETVQEETEETTASEEVIPEETDYGESTMSAYLNAVVELDVYKWGTGMPSNKEYRPDITSADYTYTGKTKTINGTECYVWQYNKNTFYGPLYIWVDVATRSKVFTGFSDSKMLNVWDSRLLITYQNLTADMLPMLDPYTPTVLDKEEKAVIAVMNEQFPQILEYCTKEFGDSVSRFTGFDYYCCKNDDGSYYGYVFSWGGTSAGYVFEFNVVRGENNEFEFTVLDDCTSY